MSIISETFVYRVIANIPERLNAVDIRNYFSFLVEKKAFYKFCYNHDRETFLMGSIIKIKANVSKLMENKGYELSDRNQKFYNAADDIFHSAECSEHEDDDISRNLSASLVQMKITENDLGDRFLIEEINESNSSENHDESILESINYRRNDLQTSLLADDNSFSEDSISEPGEGLNKRDFTSKENARFICVVKVKRKFDEILKKYYHQKFWVDVDGDVLPVRCLILDFDKLQLVMDYIPGGDNSAMKNKTRDDIFEEALHYTHCEMNKSWFFNKISELLPPGNIGVSNEGVMNILSEYLMDLSLMKDLGLKFDVNREVRRFCKFPFLYSAAVDEENSDTSSFPRVFTANGDLIPSYCDIRQINRKADLNLPNYLSSPGNDENESTVMDWHTYEEFYNVTTQKERDREICFEQEIKLLEANGDCGVVRYSDGDYWYQGEGGEIMRSLDGWVVDTKVNHVERERLTGPEKDKLIKIWNKKHGWTWKNKGKKQSEKFPIERRYYADHPLSSHYMHQFFISLMKRRLPTRCLGRPRDIPPKIWDRFFKSTWIELFGEKANGYYESKRNENSAAEKSKKTSENGHNLGKGDVNRKKGNNNRGNDRKQQASSKAKMRKGRSQRSNFYNEGYYGFPFDKYPVDQPRYPYNNTVSYDPRDAYKLYKRPLLPSPRQFSLLPTPPPFLQYPSVPEYCANMHPMRKRVNRSAENQYDMYGYDAHGRSIFGDSNEDSLMNNPRFLESQGYNSESVRSFLSSRSNANGHFYKEKAKKEVNIDINAPVAKYENDGNFTSGVSLLHPSSCCIVKATTKSERSDQNGSQCLPNADEEDEVVVEVD